MPKTKITPPENVNLTRDKIQAELKQKELEAGLLGKLFGTGGNIPKYIGGLISILLVLTITVIVFIPNYSPNEKIEIIKILSPLLTLILGYLFGSIRG